MTLIPLPNSVTISEKHCNRISTIILRWEWPSPVTLVDFRSSSGSAVAAPAINPFAAVSSASVNVSAAVVLPSGKT